MKLSTELSPFNRQMANELQHTFASNVEPYQLDDGTLVFRGPIEKLADPTHIGTHVAVSLDAEVQRALAAASPSDYEQMVQYLMANLGTQVMVQ